MSEDTQNFEIILPDGTIYRGEKRKGHLIQGYTEDGKPKRMRFLARTQCERCGECCMRDTPVILKDDFSLLKEGIISERDIYTVREGEKIRSSIDGEIYYSSMELIKIKPVLGSFTCLFYDPLEGCTIYEKRPSVCRQYECWSQNFEITGIEKRRLTRNDLFGEIEILKNAIKSHEEKCSLTKFDQLISELRKGKSENVEKLAEMIIYDYAIRDWAKEKLSLNEEVIPLIFGKTLFEIAPLYGLIIEKEGENFNVKVTQEEEE